MTEPFLLSTRALSLLRRGRDLVNSSMWRACSRATILWLMNSEPLSVWNPRTLKGNARSRASRTGGEAGRVDALDRADELELGDLVDEVEVVEALDAVEVSLVDRIDPQVAGLSEGLGAGAARRWRCARGGSARASSRGGVDSWSSGAGCRGVRWRWRRGARSGGRRNSCKARTQSLRVAGPERGAVEGIDFSEQPDVALGVAAWEGVPGAAAVGDGSCGPVLVQQAGDLRA